MSKPIKKRSVLININVESLSFLGGKKTDRHNDEMNTLTSHRTTQDETTSFLAPVVRSTRLPELSTDCVSAVTASAGAPHRHVFPNTSGILKAEQEESHLPFASSAIVADDDLTMPAQARTTKYDHSSTGHTPNLSRIIQSSHKPTVISVTAGPPTHPITSLPSSKLADDKHCTISSPANMLPAGSSVKLTDLASPRATHEQLLLNTSSSRPSTLLAESLEEYCCALQEYKLLQLMKYGEASTTLCNGASKSPSGNSTAMMSSPSRFGLLVPPPKISMLELLSSKQAISPSSSRQLAPQAAAAAAAAAAAVAAAGGNFSRGGAITTAALGVVIPLEASHSVCGFSGDLLAGSSSYIMTPAPPVLPTVPTMPYYDINITNKSAVRTLSQSVPSVLKAPVRPVMIGVAGPPPAASGNFDVVTTANIDYYNAHHHHHHKDNTTIASTTASSNQQQQLTSPSLRMILERRRSISNNNNGQHDAVRRKTFPLILHEALTEIDRVEQGTTTASADSATTMTTTTFARFLPDGKSFQIKNQHLFEQEVLPLFFPNMKRFASFQRQLNLYNFERQSGYHDLGRGVYRHDLFQRDDPQLVHQMKRRRMRGGTRKGVVP